MENKGRLCNCYQIVIKGTLARPESLDFTGFSDFRISFPLDLTTLISREKPHYKYTFRPQIPRIPGFLWHL